MTLRRWIAWKLAQLSWRADPTAHYQQTVELVDIDSRVIQTLTVQADVYGAGVNSSTGSTITFPGYMRVTDDDGTVW